MLATFESSIIYLRLTAPTACLTYFERIAREPPGNRRLPPEESPKASWLFSMLQHWPCERYYARFDILRNQGKTIAAALNGQVILNLARAMPAAELVVTLRASSGSAGRGVDVSLLLRDQEWLRSR